MQDDIPTMDVPANDLESAAVQRFLERQAAGRAAKRQRNIELRPSAHKYMSPTKPIGAGYAAVFNNSKCPAGWNASTSTSSPRRITKPRRFEKDLAEKYRQTLEHRNLVSLESVRIDSDFRPRIANMLKGFKARCRNRSRDMSVHKIWRKIEQDAPAASEEEIAAAEVAKAEEEARARADVFGIGSGKWIHRQKIARQEKERIRRQKQLRAANSSSAATPAQQRPSWNSSTLLDRRADGEYQPEERRVEDLVSLPRAAIAMLLSRFHCRVQIARLKDTCAYMCTVGYICAV